MVRDVNAYSLTPYSDALMEAANSLWHRPGLGECSVKFLPVPVTVRLAWDEARRRSMNSGWLKFEAHLKTGLVNDSSSSAIGD